MSEGGDEGEGMDDKWPDLESVWNKGRKSIEMARRFLKKCLIYLDHPLLQTTVEGQIEE